MTFDPQQAYVWIWLPQETQPLVAGKLTALKNSLVFNYGQSYLAHDKAIAINPLELPLRRGRLPLVKGLSMPSCIRDAAPDAWGRRVLLQQILQDKGSEADVTQLSELSYLLRSGSDRIGALDFQDSASDYQARGPSSASLEDLQRSADRVEAGQRLSPELDQALLHGSSIGGARPKVLIDGKEKKFVAKFSSTTDIYSVVKAEFVAMRLAAVCGLNVAPVKLQVAAHKDVLLVERFDRVLQPGGWQRRALVSALTLFGLDEMMARYASYQDLAELIRQHFENAAKTLKELFARMVFNVFCGNTDDHARNHAAFWDGQQFSLTPAYDICPQARSGQEASQAMLISGNKRMSRVSLCLESAHNFLLSPKQALALIEEQLTILGENWGEVCAQAKLNDKDRRLLWGRQFLNPFAFEDLQGGAKRLKILASELRVKS